MTEVGQSQPSGRLSHSIVLMTKKFKNIPGNILALNGIKTKGGTSTYSFPSYRFAEIALREIKLMAEKNKWFFQWKESFHALILYKLNDYENEERGHESCSGTIWWLEIVPTILPKKDGIQLSVHDDKTVKQKIYEIFCCMNGTRPEEDPREEWDHIY